MQIANDIILIVLGVAALVLAVSAWAADENGVGFIAGLVGLALLACGIVGLCML